MSKQQPFPFLKNKNIYAVASLMSKGGKTKTAIIPCSNTVFRRLIDIPTRKGTFMLSEELILHFLPKMFKNYEIREKALLRITRNADIDTETIYDEDLDYRDAMENLIKQRRRMNPVRMELSRELNKKMISSLCKELHVDKEHVFLTRVPLDMSFVFGLQGYLRNTAQDKLFYQRRTPRMTPELNDKSALIPQIMKKDVLLSYPFENIKSFINLLNEAAILAAKDGRVYLQQEDIRRAFVKVGIGAEKKSRVISDREKKITAYHESGHAILFHILPDVGPVHTVSIIPTGVGAAGYTMPLPGDDEMFNTKGKMLQDIMVSLGGRIAEEIIFKDVTTGASQDIKQATAIAKSMITKFGMSERLGLINYDNDSDEVFIGRDFGHTSRGYGEKVAGTIDEEVKRIIDECYLKARTLIQEYHPVLEKCAQLLLEKEKITRSEFEALFADSEVEG